MIGRTSTRLVELASPFIPSARILDTRVAQLAAQRRFELTPSLRASIAECVHKLETELEQLGPVGAARLKVLRERLLRPTGEAKNLATLARENPSGPVAHSGICNIETALVNQLFSEATDRMRPGWLVLSHIPPIRDLAVPVLEETEHGSAIEADALTTLVEAVRQTLWTEFGPFYGALTEAVLQERLFSDSPARLADLAKRFKVTHLRVKNISIALSEGFVVQLRRALTESSLVSKTTSLPSHLQTANLVSCAVGCFRGSPSLKRYCLEGDLPSLLPRAVDLLRTRINDRATTELKNRGTVSALRREAIEDARTLAQALLDRHLLGPQDSLQELEVQLGLHLGPAMQQLLSLFERSLIDAALEKRRAE